MKFAACLFTFDRPDYLERIARSLTANTHFNEVDWFVFQDHPITMDGEMVGDTEKTNKNIEILQNMALYSKAPFNFIMRNVNHSIAKNKLDAHYLTMEKYDAVFMFEDDMIVSKYYIKLLMDLHKQFPTAILSACDQRKEIRNAVDKLSPNYDEVTFVPTHWWGYLMPTRVMKFFNPYLEIYSSFIGWNYRNRPHEKIRERFNIQVTSHDGFMENKLKMMNIQRLNLCIPRGRYIGREGLHSKSKMYEDMGFSEFRDYQFEADQYITKFKKITDKERLEKYPYKNEVHPYYPKEY